MQKEIKEIIEKDGTRFYRITTSDSRWYAKESKNVITGLPEMKFFPSVTWIKNYYYTSPYLINWIAEKGLTEADRIKKEAGTKGDKIHQATQDIDKGLEIKIDDKYLNKENGEMEELTVDEIEAIQSYVDYLEIEKPDILATEKTVFCENQDYEYAGTLDRIWAKGEVKKGVRQIYVVDFKTSQSVRKDMIIQVSAYSHSDIDYKEFGITDEEWNNRKLLILQLGYKGYRTYGKPKYKETEVNDRYDLFDIAYKSWKEENNNTSPLQRDFPMVLKSDFRINQLKKSSKKSTKKKIKKTVKKIKIWKQH